jgi:hypothetical protein
VAAVLSLTAALALDAVQPARPPAPAPSGAPATAGGAPSPATIGAGAAAAGSTSAPVPPSSAAAPPVSPAAGPGASPPSAEPAGAPPPGVPAAGAAPAAVERPGMTSPPRPAGVDVGAEAVAAEVLSPYLSLGGALFARVSGRRRAGPAPSVSLAFLHLRNDVLLPGDTVVLRWTGGAITACPGWGLGRSVQVQACAHAAGAWLTATDRAVTNPRTAARTWWGAGALARLGARIGAGFTLELEAGVTVPLIERRFMTSTPERTVAETPRISGSLGLGLAHGL